MAATSSRYGRTPRLCLWSGTVVDSERACGGACRCNASVVCAVAAGWKLFADSNKKASRSCGWKLRLHASITLRPARSAVCFFTFKCKCIVALPLDSLGGPSEERRLIAKGYHKPPHPWSHSPAKKITLVDLVSSLIISKALKASFPICSASHGV